MIQLAFMAGHGKVDSVIEARANRKRTTGAPPATEPIAAPPAMDPATEPPPAAVSALLDRWRRSGGPRQPGILWDRPKWLLAFPSCAGMLKDLPDALDREAIRAAARRAANGPMEAMTAFVAIMAWGYGLRGFGRHRTNRILINRRASDRLAAAASTLAELGPAIAYDRLGSDLRLRHLGPAFGTKFLYFCPQRGGDQGALILDSLVAKWLAGHAGLTLDPVSWNPAVYRTYLDTLHACCVLKVGPGQRVQVPSG